MKLTLVKHLFLEKIFAVSVLFMLSVVNFSVGYNQDNMYINVLVIFVSLLFMLKNKFIATKILVLDKTMFIFLLYLIMSLTWSHSTLVTFFSLVHFLALLTFSLFISTCFNYDEFSKLIYIYIFVTLGLSILLLYLSPETAMHIGGFHDGRWSGVFGHKNAFATFCVIGILFFISKIMMKEIVTFDYIILILLILALVNAESATAWAVLLVIISGIIFFQSIKLMTRRNLLLFISLVCFLLPILVYLIYLTLTNFSPLIELLDRDITLSGRTNIWEIVIYFIQDRIFLGYGYNAFWNSSYSNLVASINGFYLTSSHSGVLDLLLDFGLFGTCIIVVHFFHSYRIYFRISKDNTSFIIKWMGIYLIFLILNNITDSRLFNSNSIYLVLYLVISFNIRKTLLFNNVSKRNHILDHKLANNF